MGVANVPCRHPSGRDKKQGIGLHRGLARRRPERPGYALWLPGDAGWIERSALLEDADREADWRPGCEDVAHVARLACLLDCMYAGTEQVCVASGFVRLTGFVRPEGGSTNCGCGHSTASLQAPWMCAASFRWLLEPDLMPWTSG